MGHNDFGSFLKKYREEHNLTLRDLNKITGISYSQLGKIERGENNPSRQTVLNVAKSLNLPEDELLIMAGYVPAEDSKQVMVMVSGKQIYLTPEEFKVFEEFRKQQPAIFHDLATDTEKKVKSLISMWEALKTQMDKLNNE